MHPASLRRFITRVVLLCGLVATLVVPQAQASAQTIFADALATGWYNASWAQVDLNATNPVHTGSSSIAVNYNSDQGLQFCHLGFSTAGYTQLRFFVHGGTVGGQSVQVYTTRVGDTSEHFLIKQKIEPLVAGDWREVRVSLNQIEADNRNLRCIVWQDASGSTQPTFYVDDVVLTADEQPGSPSISEVYMLPAALPKDGATSTILRAKVSDPQGASDIARVVVDATALGRGVVALRDDGRSGDYGPNDGWYGAAVSAAQNATLGEHSLVVQAVDNQGRSDYSALGTIVVLRAPGGDIPPTLPQRLGWGTTKLPGTDTLDWQGQSGVPWDYSYFYITADNPDSVDNENWETWGDGTSGYVTRLTTQAWNKNYIPVVSVYLMLYTLPSAGEGGFPYAAKLQRADSVASYIASLRAAAQQARGEKPVIFHIEPDMYGFMQQYTNNRDRPASVFANDPASIPVTLNKQGEGYANNFADFGRYLAQMIKQEAPNALVAMHASMYATSREPWQGTPSEAENTAYLTANFIDKAGGAQSDLLFVEWSDRDAGYQGQPDSRLWWDDANRTLPHFSRVLLWENKLSEVSGKRLILWQVPCGNMNLDNSPTRYQDNRAAYAFRHPRDLFDAGVIGVLFGGGIPIMTQPNTDGGLIREQGAIAYAPPAAPTSLSALEINGNSVALRWNDVPEPDIWFYRIFMAGGGGSYTQDVSRSNASTLELPSGGVWVIWVRAYDAQGNEGAASNSVRVNSTGAARYNALLPIVQR